MDRIKELTLDERHDIAMALLTERQLDEYAAECEKQENEGD